MGAHKIGKSILLDVKPHKVYFIRAAVQMGIMVGRPQLEIMSTAAGLCDYNRNEERIEEKRKRRGNSAEQSQED